MPDPVTEAERLDRAIGERLKRARRSRGYTQSMLGDALGVTFQQIQKYERGINRISTSALVLISRQLEVSPLELLGLPEGGPSDIDWDLFGVEGSDELLRYYSEISSPKLRRAVLEFTREIARTVTR
ncbi:MAG TPA: helix-turn-helix transcriptional regulator [Caulobacteraceae bacterium]|nr:helix-turn-helix transcriptional regulator [Caulobacteraceae bacterium]